MSLPRYFYNLDANLPDGRKRWFDEFSDSYPSIYQPGKDNNPYFLKNRADRNEAYARWQAAFFSRGTDGSFIPAFKPKMFKWQAIRVLSFKHSESSERDWWENYQDCVFRVFVEPETVYDQVTGEYKQWYLLSPEDGYLVNRHEIESKNASLPGREYLGRERWLSADKRLRRARFIPTECCHHLRNETTAGKLSTEL